MERKQACKGNSHTREHKGRHMSEDPEDRKKTTLQKELTSYRTQGETFVKRPRRWKENNLAKRTHILESTRGDICQKT
jgi:hypothetical protein